MATAKKPTKAAPTVKKLPPRADAAAAKAAAIKATPAAKAAPAVPAQRPGKVAPADKTAPTAKRVAKAGGKPPATNGDDHSDVPTPRGTTKDGIVYTKDFDVKFLKAQRDLLIAERESLLGQADRLEDEANSLIEDGEMGDVQFDDESGEGDTMVVERERDLALSAQARQTVADIDAALERLAAGTYGYSVHSGKPIPRERLEAIPWATELVEEKVGGIGRR